MQIVAISESPNYSSKSIVVTSFWRRYNLHYVFTFTFSFPSDVAATCCAMPYASIKYFYFYWHHPAYLMTYHREFFWNWIIFFPNVVMVPLSGTAIKNHRNYRSQDKIPKLVTTRPFIWYLIWGTMPFFSRTRSVRGTELNFLCV
jgi:hypothetical protein